MMSGGHMGGPMSGGPAAFGPPLGGFGGGPMGPGGMMGGPGMHMMQGPGDTAMLMKQQAGLMSSAADAAAAVAGVHHSRCGSSSIVKRQ